MRHPALFLALILAAGCRPSATVERTTPVANLQIYRAVRLAVRAGGEGGAAQVGPLEHAVRAELQGRCDLEVVTEGDADLQLDLTIQRVGRGGGGLIENPNLATMDVLMVLSDGIDGELVGSARVLGKSSAVLMDGASPEQQAVEVVGRTIGEVLDKSGCRGPRIARPTPQPGPTGDGGVTPPGGDAGADPTAPGDPDAAKRAEADAANDAGKQRFRAGDPAAALADFRTALGLVRDPRYAMNICLAHEALEQWDQAVTACNDVLALSPPPALADKARQRLEIIAQRR